MRIVFMGTPDFAVPALSQLSLSDNHEIVAVVTQPDRPGNRGVMTSPPVKNLAEQLKIPVHQFEKISKEGIDILKTYKPDTIITAAYGQILSREILDIPKYGVFNIHASLLPKYRGSSPIQWAIINGEKVTGITIMKTAEGLDTGDILFKRTVLILPEDDAKSMFDKLAAEGAYAIMEALPLIEADAVCAKQNESDATYYPMLKKSDGEIDWTSGAENIFNKVRGMCGWPVAFTSYNGKMLKIHKCRSVDTDGISGEISIIGNEIFVGCGIGSVLLLDVQPEGKKIMTASDFANGARIKTGDRVG